MSHSLTADILEVLRTSSENVLILTVGNDFRSDDGVGSYIASLLKPTPRMHVIDAGYTPENIIEEIISLGPASIIVIDAADFKGIPGEARIIPENAIPETTLSTHMVPMSVVLKIIQKSITTTVTIIGIQPQSVQFGNTVSAEVKQTADLIIKTINEYVSQGGI